MPKSQGKKVLVVKSHQKYSFSRFFFFPLDFLVSMRLSDTSIMDIMTKQFRFSESLHVPFIQCCIGTYVACWWPW